MEKEIRIKTPDRHVIYGTLRIPKKKTGTLLVFVHGLTGHRNEHIFYNGARFFADRGIATFRFDLYSGEKSGRVMTDCGISTHAEDLNAVMKFFRKKFRKIFVAGHSLGGLTILLSNADLADGIVFWDSSSKPRGRLGDFNYDKKLKKYVIRWGTECLMSKRMFTEWKNFPSPKKAIAKINRPVKVIVSGRGILQKAGREYYRFAKKPKGFSIIKGASHNFDEEGVAEKLFLETLDFIKK